ncbi:cilia- and flagella-associated protein 100 isoform X2 [Scophthalmus maximus]|uniref:cilia- and flagella-associated protein 100 isoform X2 n=1 Tax=Scophthalmus maximus TaxID=52904 RepID=UPI001FA878D7|nr:cilia- and flagella-associated protein 100 isoform X2 [Scophthalmus maximus]
MSAPQAKEPEISSGATDGAAKSHKQDMRRARRETRQSPFKVPDNNSIFLLSAKEKKDQKEETRKFLALPIEEKTTHAARMMAKLKKELVGEVEEEEEEEKKEKMKNLKQIKGKTTLPKPTPGRHELKMAMMRRENISKDSKHDLISMERQKAVLELSLMTKRSEISKMDRAIAKEERQLRRLERTIEGDNLSFEEFLRENEKKSVEARTFFEREAKSKQEKTAKIKKLTAEIGTITSELAKSEEILVDYKRYKELLFKLSPPEWQEAQRAKASGARVLSVEDTRGEQKKQPVESAISNKGSESRASSPGRELPPLRETGPSSAHGDTRITRSKLDGDSSEYEEEPELYFSDPHQLLDLVTALTEQNLSLIQNSTRVEEAAEELRQSLGTARKKIENDEEQLKLQINDINQRINEEKARGNRLKQKVQLHVSLNSEDQDVMLDALGEKVAEVHRACVDDRVTNLSTLEKLASIENHLSVLLQSLESMPEESVAMMKKIKDSERRSREREELLREQREKQKERMERYLERSLADSKKISGRKLMPRCLPVAQKVKVTKVDNIHAEDELHAYLFTSEETE